VRLLVASLFLVAFLDALTTYIIVAWGLGVETNPAVADVVNSNPAVLFPLAFISAAVLAVALHVAAWLSNRLPPRLRVAVMRYLTWAVAAVVLVRAAVVVNNLAIIVNA
jgi:hypothetical protein